MSVGKGVENCDGPSHTAGECKIIQPPWQFGGSSEANHRISTRPNNSNVKVYTPKNGKQVLKEIHVHTRPQQHYTQQPKGANSLNVHQQMNGQIVV